MIYLINNNESYISCSWLQMKTRSIKVKIIELFEHGGRECKWYVHYIYAPARQGKKLYINFGYLKVLCMFM